MADAAIRSDAAKRPGLRLHAVLGWARGAGPFKRPGVSTGANRPIYDVSEEDRRDTYPEPAANHAHVVFPFPLLNAYANSAIDIARHAATFDVGDGALELGPVAVQSLLHEVIKDLEPAAHQAGLTLLRDANSRCDGVCCADPVLLRRVVSHLLLRALSMERAPGHVRVMVTFTRHETQILILSRTPEAALAAHPDAARHDLIAPQRLLRAMGGSLVLEPRRAGYLPLCIALRGLTAASALHAA